MAKTASSRAALLRRAGVIEPRAETDVARAIQDALDEHYDEWMTRIAGIVERAIDGAMGNSVVVPPGKFELTAPGGKQE